MEEAGEARSEWNTGDVRLGQAVDVDGGGCIAELDESYLYEDKSDDRVHRFQQLELALLPRCPCIWSSI